MPVIIVAVTIITLVVVMVAIITAMITVVLMIPVRMVTCAYIASGGYRYKTCYNKGEPDESLFHDICIYTLFNRVFNY